MQGAYWLEDTVTKATVELHNRFRELCSQVGSSLSPMTLRQQADHIANALQGRSGRISRAPASGSCRDAYASTPVVARVAVTGYGEQGPESVVVGLGIAIDRATNRWEAQVRPLARLTFSDCGVRFHGPGKRRDPCFAPTKACGSRKRNSTNRRGEARGTVTRQLRRGDNPIGPRNVPSGGSADDHARPRLWCATGSRQPADRYRRHSARRCHRGDTNRVVVAVPAHQRW